MSTQSEALRPGSALWLAQVLDAYSTAPHHKEAAAELRRLHAENERLHQINQSHEMKLSVRGYEIQIADLEAQRDALLEALKLARSIIGHPDDAHSQMIDAAIKEAEETK